MSRAPAWIGPWHICAWPGWSVAANDLWRPFTAAVARELDGFGPLVTQAEFSLRCGGSRPRIMRAGDRADARARA